MRRPSAGEKGCCCCCSPRAVCWRFLLAQRRPAFCSIQAFLSLGATCPHHGGQFALLKAHWLKCKSHPNTLLMETSRTMNGRIFVAQPIWHVKLTITGSKTGKREAISGSCGMKQIIWEGNWSFTLWGTEKVLVVPQGHLSWRHWLRAAPTLGGPCPS